MSVPSKRTRPPVGSSSRVTTRPIVDLPQPLSPTTPRVSPGRTLKLTPSTAFTAPTVFWNRMPRLTGKCFSSFSTSRIGSAPRARLDRAEGSQAVAVTADSDLREIRFRSQLRSHLLGPDPPAGVARQVTCHAVTRVGLPHERDPVSYTHLRAHETDSYLV